MGQAKLRGPRETRVAEGRAKEHARQLARAEELRQERERFNALPASKKARIKDLMLATALVSSVVQLP